MPKKSMHGDEEFKRLAYHLIKMLQKVMVVAAGFQLYEAILQTR